MASEAHDEFHLFKSRMKMNFESLVAKYSQPVKSDVLDLNSLRVVRDRGYLAEKLDRGFGCAPFRSEVEAGLATEDNFYVEPPMAAAQKVKTDQVPVDTLEPSEESPHIEAAALMRMMVKRFRARGAKLIRARGEKRIAEPDSCDLELSDTEILPWGQFLPTDGEYTDFYDSSDDDCDDDGAEEECDGGVNEEEVDDAVEQQELYTGTDVAEKYCLNDTEKSRSDLESEVDISNNGMIVIAQEGDILSAVHGTPCEPVQQSPGSSTPAPWPPLPISNMCTDELSKEIVSPSGVQENSAAYPVPLGVITLHGQQHLSSLFNQAPAVSARIFQPSLAVANSANQHSLLPAPLVYNQGYVGEPPSTSASTPSRNTPGLSTLSARPPAAPLGSLHFTQGEQLSASRTSSGGISPGLSTLSARPSVQPGEFPTADVQTKRRLFEMSGGDDGGDAKRCRFVVARSAASTTPVLSQWFKSACHSMRTRPIQPQPSPNLSIDYMLAEIRRKKSEFDRKNQVSLTEL